LNSDHRPIYAIFKVKYAKTLEDIINHTNKEKDELRIYSNYRSNLDPIHHFLSKIYYLKNLIPIIDDTNFNLISDKQTSQNFYNHLHLSPELHQNISEKPIYKKRESKDDIYAHNDSQKKNYQKINKELDEYLFPKDQVKEVLNVFEIEKNLKKKEEKEGKEGK